MKDRILESFTIGDVKLKNRIIRAATHEGMADENGLPTQKLIDLYKRLAKGGVGGIITGYAGVQQEGKSSLYNMLMIDSDDKVESYRELTKEVHKESVPIFLQIAHCGRATNSNVTGKDIVAPSAIKDRVYGELPIKLEEGVIEEIIENFIKAASRARKCGFDGVQVHLAHGYLLSQFLSSYSNRRKDKWGGTLENKFRIIKEIILGIKEAEPGYPVFVKLNGHDGRKKGMRVDEAVQVAKMLEDIGCNAIEVSCGFPEDGQMTAKGPEIPFDAIFSVIEKFRDMPGIMKSIMKRVLPILLKKEKVFYGYNVDSATEIKNAVNIPVIAVGGIHRIENIENAILEKKLDAVSMARPLICEPDLVNKFREGRSTEAKCIQCNYCGIFGTRFPIKCYQGKLPKNFNNKLKD